MITLDATPRIESIRIVKDPLTGSRTWTITYRATAAGYPVNTGVELPATEGDLYSDVAGDALTAMIAAYGVLGYELPA